MRLLSEKSFGWTEESNQDEGAEKRAMLLQVRGQPSHVCSAEPAAPRPPASRSHLPPTHQDHHQGNPVNRPILGVSEIMVSEYRTFTSCKVRSVHTHTGLDDLGFLMSQPVFIREDSVYSGSA